MVKKLLDYIKGWLYICVTGANIERFLNICNHNNIQMKNVTIENSVLKLRLDVRNFKQLKEIAKKSKVHIRIEERYGLPFFLFKNKKRKMFFAGIISALILVYIMSLHIWQISFDGNYSHTEDELMDFLEKSGISNGVKKKECDADEIEKALRNEYNDIKWASVEIVGTRMIIHVKENFNEVNEAEENDTCSIVADKDAEIISIVTGKGTPLVKAGDIVKAGDVLIGGYYDIKSDYDELLGTKYVAADGIILGKTTYVLNETIDRNYEEKVYTGNSSKKYEICIWNKAFEIGWFSGEYKVFDESENVKQVVVGENFYLPLYYIEKNEKEYVIKEKYYSNKEAYEAGEKYVNDFLQKLVEKGIQITQNNVTIEVNEKSIIISGDVICCEYIGEKRN